MSLYANAAGEVRDIPDGMVAAWGKAGNPKAKGWVQLPPRPSARHFWDGNDWKAQSLPVPFEVTARQARLCLLRRGILLSQVDNAIDAIKEDRLRNELRIEWQYASVIQRSHPMVIQIAAAIGLSETQLDDAFREAATI